MIVAIVCQLDSCHNLKTVSMASSEAGPSTSRPLVKQAQWTGAPHLGLNSKDVIISVKVKHSPFRASVPCMPSPLAVVCAILNIIIPGSGTFVSAFSVFCCGFAERQACSAFGWNLLAAALQLLTVFLLVGWIWSIHWGIMFVTLSSEYEHERLKRNRRSTRVSNASSPPA